MMRQLYLETQASRADTVCLVTSGLPGTELWSGDIASHGDLLVPLAEVAHAGGPAVRPVTAGLHCLEHET